MTCLFGPTGHLTRVVAQSCAYHYNPPILSSGYPQA